jgi:DNA-binding IclR family transcriptional regulator
VNISQVRGPAAISSHNWVGRGTPLHATSSGKVLLAYAPDAVRKVALARDLQRFTSATVVDPDVLQRELDRILERGWGSTVEEFEVGLNAVAAPVRDGDGEVAAAVSVAGPAFRMPPERFPDIARQVVAGAGELSRRLGFFG